MFALRWVALLLVVGCAAQSNTPFGANLPPPPNRSGQQAQAEAERPRPPEVPKVDAGAKSKEYAKLVAVSYDKVFTLLVEGDSLARNKKPEESAQKYALAAQIARSLIAWFEDESNRLGRGPGVRYQTRTHGVLDEAALLGKLRPAGARARAAARKQRDIRTAALAKEMHATSKAQRAVLAGRGRPDRVKREPKKTSCWIYHLHAGDESFCWSSAGKLARHDRPGKKPTTVAVAAPPKHGQSPRPAEQPAEQPERAAEQPADQPAEQPAEQASNASDDHYPSAALRRQAAAIVLARRGLAGNDLDQLRSGSCDAIGYMQGDLPNLAYLMCAGAEEHTSAGHCDLMKQDELLRYFCYEPPTWCSGVMDHDLQNLCFGSRYCSGIQDGELRGICEQIR